MDSSDLWKARGKVDFIVIYDWNSSPELFETGHYVASLKDAIYKVCTLCSIYDMILL